MKEEDSTTNEASGVAGTVPMSVEQKIQEQSTTAKMNEGKEDLRLRVQPSTSKEVPEPTPFEEREIHTDSFEDMPYFLKKQRARFLRDEQEKRKALRGKQKRN